jgi:hypothetical protein
VLGIIAWLALAAMVAQAREVVFLGPVESGTWSGSSSWLTGASGAGATWFDFNDVGKGACAFVISNGVAGKENRADWRCEMFSLGPAAGGARPISFSFSYKLPDRVRDGDDLHVQLRFFDAATNGVADRRIKLGSHTRDSAMENYRTLTMNNIRPPARARLADITIIANIDSPWSSGAGRFDDFSVTTEPGPSVLKWALAGAGLAVIGIVIALLVRFSRQVTQRPCVPVHR